MNRIDKKFINKFLYITLPFLSIYIITLVLEKYDLFDLLGSVLGIITPLIVAYILAALVNPIVVYFENKKISRGIAILIVLLISMLSVAVLVKLFIPLIVSQGKALFDASDEIQLAITNIGNNLIANLKDAGLSENLSTIETLLKDQLNQFVQFFIDNFSNLSDILINSLQVILTSVLNIVLTLTLFIYILIDFERINNFIMRLVPIKFRSEFSNTLSEISISINGYINSTLLSSLIVFVLSWIALIIFKVPNAFVLALFIGITNIIPYIGPYIGAIPAMLIGLAINLGTVLYIIIMIVVVQQVEGSVIKPILMKKTTSIHPITTLMGIIIFNYFWGFVGILVSIPVISIIKIIFIRLNKMYKFIKLDKE